MSGNPPGPTGITAAPPVQDGTLALQPSPQPGPTGAAVAPPPAVAAGATTETAAVAAAATDEADADIDALDLSDTAKKAAYALKKAHPTVTFTSGKRTKQDQARAMAGNVVKNRDWIEQTYAKSGVRDACQKWLDDNPNKTTKDEIELGLVAVLNKYTDEQLGVFSKHISGNAFDVQPVTESADAIKKTLGSLPGLGKFLEKEGGLVRWHCQF